MTEKPTEDETEFGAGAWVYCSQHLRPHTTGWCSVHNRHKRKLEATDREAALAECRAQGLRIFQDG